MGELFWGFFFWKKNDFISFHQLTFKESTLLLLLFFFVIILSTFYLSDAHKRFKYSFGTQLLSYLLI